MESLVALISASLSAIALGASVVSLALHYVRRKEPIEVSDLRSEMQNLRTDHLELLDKVEHWVKRDRVRRLRAAREAQVEDLPTQEAQPTKQQLRARLLNAQRGN